MLSIQPHFLYPSRRFRPTYWLLLSLSVEGIGTTLSGKRGGSVALVSKFRVVNTQVVPALGACDRCQPRLISMGAIPVQVPQLGLVESVDSSIPQKTSTCS